PAHAAIPKPGCRPAKSQCPNALATEPPLAQTASRDDCRFHRYRPGRTFHRTMTSADALPLTNPGWTDDDEPERAARPGQPRFLRRRDHDGSMYSTCGLRPLQYRLRLPTA